MASITPDTYIKLVRFDATKEHQITFTDKLEQYNYFASLGGLVLDDFTYQRKEGVIRANYVFDNLQQYNYLFYQNSAYSNKVYFCYIKNMTYLNDGCTAIEIEEDVFQTWQFDVQYKTMFVEREHVDDDTIGKHTIQEGLQLGEYICEKTEKYDGFDTLVYVLLVTKWKDGSDTSGSIDFGKTPYMGGAYVIRDFYYFSQIIAEYDAGGIPGAIYGAYIVPMNMINVSQELIDGTKPFEQYLGQQTPKTEYFHIDKPSTINGYTPKNNKLFCYPYRYLLLSNNNGSSNILHYERFKDEDCYFKITGIPTIGTSIKICPDSYDVLGANEEQGIMAGKFPPLNWFTDEFTVWCVQNANNINLGILYGSLQVGLGVAGGNIEQAMGGIGQVLGTMQDVAYNKMFDVPSSKGNTNGGDINLSNDANTFYFYKMSIKKEFAKLIDNYLSVYGYKVNEWKIPNLHSRKNWNYVKTIDAIIESNVVPEKALNEFKSLFNNGITLWHSPVSFLDYTQSNNIL